MAGSLSLKWSALLCKFGWHGKSEDRVIKAYPSGVKILAAHCSRCGKCHVAITPEMSRIMNGKR